MNTKVHGVPVSAPVLGSFHASIANAILQRNSDLPKITLLVNGGVKVQVQLSLTWRAVVAQALFHIIKGFRVIAADYFLSVLVGSGCCHRIP